MRLVMHEDDLDVISYGGSQGGWQVFVFLVWCWDTIVISHQFNLETFFG
jgi:hypothetical protein